MTVQNKIPLLDFGSKVVIKGVLFTDETTDKSYVALLPQKRIEKDPEPLHPTLEEWHQIFEQQDFMNVETTSLNGEKVILRKSQRNVDGVISWKVFKRDGYACRYCGIDHVPLTVDHIVTWETGGATHMDNLLTSCNRCNRKRGNTEYDGWLKSDYYKSRMKFLSQKVIDANQKIVSLLTSLPRVTKIRKR